MLQNSKPKSWAALQNLACVGTYVPRRCGIATFTHDLTDALTSAAPDINTMTVAMNDRPEGYRYANRVWFEINQNRLVEYRLAADFLNMSNVDVVSLQHEFGIFGGPDGSYILEMLRRLRMPVVTTLHTVLRTPTDSQLKVMRQLTDLTDCFVVMAERAEEFLRDIYHVPNEKIQLIPHGIPDVPFVDPNYYKDIFGVEGKKVILTFGLLGPSKGIENMIEALPSIIEKHPDTVYIVLGATHPGVIAYQGEEYRLGLQRRAKELGIADNIIWVNQFVELEQLIEFLGAADVYVTPYLNEAQITSGTLSYALGSGKAVVSTPYWHAQELLAEDRGILVPFADTNALANGINHLFDHESDRHAIRKRAYQYTRSMVWQEVAEQHLSLFQSVREHRNQNPKPNLTARPNLLSNTSIKTPELAEIKLEQLVNLTDSVGLLRAAIATVPDRNQGYTTDDNARALIITLIAQDYLHATHAQPRLEDLTTRYLSFLGHAFNAENKRFRHHLSYDRQWFDTDGSEDSHGRAIWALGETVARSTTRGHMTFATNLFQQALEPCTSLQSPHGWAYALIGIHAYLRRFSGDSHARRVREQLAQKLYDAFQRNGSSDWHWLSDELTYANAQIPHALLLSGRWMFNNEMIQAALRVLDWLYNIETADDNDHFAPIGSDGWLVRNQSKTRFNQLPIEASGMINATLEAYRITADKRWLDRAYTCLNWFLGDNDLHQPLYDPTTGGCAEALLPHGVSENQSAESTTAWLLALLSLYDHTQGEDATTTTESESTPTKPAKSQSPTTKQSTSKIKSPTN
ncbi:glycosyltransferase [Poriferisphaera sp. WC338]|uniref:glycosyltransferase family 4 protein n=1 Tax=Poriferisphaera sp. WC338 TaxID=3425129 RepID=UPI003D812867